MADATTQGYIILRGAVSRTLCESVALEFVDAKAVVESDALLEYTPTQACTDITRQIQQMHSHEVARLKPNAKPVSVSVAKLRLPPIPSVGISGAPDDIYFVVALSRLEKANGWVSFVNRPNAGGKEEEVILEAGDAVIWRGDCIGRRGLGEGGLMQVVTYR